ncbi:MAG: AtpZ/AtpI family protein [Chloroflexi bacterium]|nr:AtpZ/AtpI family protein [Chloroflexota bacterium]
MGAWRAAALATEFGFAVVGSLLGGVLFGQFLDRRLGTAPTFFLIGLIGGFVFSIYLIYMIYRVQIQVQRRQGVGAASGRRHTSRGTSTNNTSNEGD